MITGIIMASGFSKRMNKNKLLLPFGDGVLIEKVIRTVKNSLIDEVILVYQDNLVEDIGNEYKIQTVMNEHPEVGQSQSMKLGIKSSSLDTKAFMFFVGDQPFLEEGTINKLIKAFYEGHGDIIVPLYGGKRGNPVIFSCKFKDKLLDIEGDKGGRTIIEESINEVGFIDINEEFIGIDIDTWEEYQSLNKMEMK